MNDSSFSCKVVSDAFANVIASWLECSNKSLGIVFCGWVIRSWFNVIYSIALFDEQYEFILYEWTTIVRDDLVSDSESGEDISQCSDRSPSGCIL